MPKRPRTRRVFSIRKELLTKSREAALAAVQIFNSPLITFKSEIFIVLMNIAWTYLLHAYYRTKRIEYRYFDQGATRKVFHRTKAGAYKYWELERCLNNNQSPVDKDAANNLRFLIGIRHEIEHQMTSQIDDSISAKFQACCLNYNEYVKQLFGNEYAIDKYLAFSLQFSSINRQQLNGLPSMDDLPPHIRAYIEGFEGNLTDLEFGSPKYAYRVIFTPKATNNKGQADQVIEFIKPGSPLANNINATYTVIKETERPKHLPGSIVATMKNEGYKKFKPHHHTNLWQQLDGKNPAKGLGVMVLKTWYWYDAWVDIVREHCKENAATYTESIVTEVNNVRVA